MRIGRDKHPWNTEHFGLAWILVEFVFTPVKLVVEIRILNVEFIGVDPDDRSWQR